MGYSDTLRMLLAMQIAKKKLNEFGSLGDNLPINLLWQITQANEGLVRDPLLSNVRPGGDWHPGSGNIPSSTHCL